MIAIQENPTFPLIIGDLLTSSSIDKNNFIFPSFNKSIDLPYKFYPSKLTQKIYIVNPNIAIAIAGDYEKNKAFVNDIKAFFDDKEATNENMNVFMHKYVNQTLENEAYGICRVDPESLEPEFRYLGNWQTKQTSKMGTIKSIGSGTSGFFKKIDNFGENNLIKVESYNDAIENFLLLISTIFGEERYFADNILDAWGAGFEIIVFDYKNRKFIKIDEITFIIWNAKFNIKKEELEYEPVSTMTYKYLGESLSISCHIGDPPRLHIALPIYMGIDEFDQSLLPSKLFTCSSRICNIIEIVIGKNIIPVCVYTENLNTVFIKYDEEKKFLVGISTQLTTEIEEKVRKLLRGCN